MVLFMMLYKLVLTFQFVMTEISSVTIQMNATDHEQYFPLVLFIMLHKVVAATV